MLDTRVFLCYVAVSQHNMYYAFMKLPERAVGVIAKIEEFLFGSAPLPRAAYDLFVVSSPFLRRAFQKYVLAGKFGVWRSWEEFCDWFVLSYGSAMIRTGEYDARRYRFSVRWVCEKVSDLMAYLEDKANEKHEKLPAPNSRRLLSSRLSRTSPRSSRRASLGG